MAKMESYSIAKDRMALETLPKIDAANGLIGGEKIEYSSKDFTQAWALAMKNFLTNLQWLVYMTQLRDIAEQQTNANMKTASANFNISGL
jgi:N-acetylmuramoyl-L-alanine amidase